MIKDVEIREATAEDARRFFGKNAPLSCYAWVASYKGSDACFAGVAKHGNNYVAFSDIKPNDAPKMTIWKTAVELNRRIKSLGVPVITACKRGAVDNQKFVERLGYRHYLPHGELEIYT